MECRNVRETFPGIGCARKNAAGKTTAEYYGVAPRALYRKYGFREAELTEEFGYPNQVFVLKGSHC